MSKCFCNMELINSDLLPGSHSSSILNKIFIGIDMFIVILLSLAGILSLFLLVIWLVNTSPTTNPFIIKGVYYFAVFIYQFFF